MRIARFGVAAIIVLLIVGQSNAQLTSGAVTGTFTDPTGALLPKGEISITNASTGVVLNAVTSGEGIFTFPVVPVGRYTFKATAPGFKTVTGSLQVELNTSRTLNVRMDVGTTGETIDVAEAAAAVETNSTQIASNFSREEILNVPIASVNVNNLALLTPNTVDINTTGLNRAQVMQKVSSPVGGSVASVGGSRARNNSFIVDGVDNNDPIQTGPQGTVIQDAVQQFSVVKNSFDAEFGQFSGGLFNIVTRTGTNQLHGSGFWYGQNRHLNASDYSAQNLIRTGVLSDKPRYDYNRLGATIGGPIAKNKLFFFGAYEFENLGSASSSTTALFPTAQGLQTLSSLPAGITKQGTPGKVSPFILNFLKTYGVTAAQASPATAWPTVLGTPIPIGPVSRVFPSFATNHRFLVSADWNAHGSDQLHFRFNYDRGPNQFVPGFPIAGLNATKNVTNNLFSAAYVHAFTTSLLNEARVAYHRQITANAFADANTENIPNIQVAAGLLIGPASGAPSGSFNHIYQFNNNTTWQKSRHLFKFGTDLRNNIVGDRSRPAPRGDYQYSSLEEFAIDAVPTINGQRGIGNTELSLNNYFLSFYGQDQWKIRPTITLYLGVRYEFNSLLKDLAAQKAESIADVPGVIEFRKPTVEHNNWAPRVGFAWDIFGDGKSALRGGYGISYAPIFGAFVGGGLLPSSVQQVFFTTCVPNCPIPVSATNFLANGGIPNVLAPFNTPAAARAAIATYVPDIKRPYVQTSTLSLEHEFWHGWVGTMRYLHTKGTHLSVQGRLNAGQAPATGYLPMYFKSSDVPPLATLNTMPTSAQFLAKAVTPYTQYGFTGLLTTHFPIGSSVYDGLSVEVSRHFSAGLQFNTNYTWSKFIDTGTNEFFNSFINPRRPQDFRNITAERGPSVLDVPHRFVGELVWDTPWFRANTGAVHHILSGWSMAVVYSASSGQPFTALSLTNALGTGDRQVMRTVFNPNGTSDTGTTSNPVRNSAGATVAYLAVDSNARYVQAQPGTLPTASRNSLRAPGINNTDFSLMKNVNFAEQKRVQFGAQFFNVFNHPQFTAANLLAIDAGLGQSYAFVGSPSFNNMKTSGGTGGARIIQLNVRLQF